MSNDPKRSQPKVLHVLTQMAVGGAQKNTLFTVGSQLAQGWDVHLVAGPPVEDGGVGLLSEAQQLGDRLHLEPALVRRIAPALDGLALARLIRLMRQHRFDVVHTHSSKAGILGRLAASISGVPVVIHTVHGWGFHDRQSAAVQRFYVQLERKAAGVTSRWITVSDRDARVGVERGIAPASAFAIIRSGIDIDAFARARLPRATVRQQLGLPLDARVLGTVGRLSQQKDPLSFVRAARHVADSVPGTHFVMVGDGELRPQVEAEIARLGLGEQFVITGFRPDVPELLQSFDVFALSSLWEGLPRVVPEAMAAGLPVVATRTCGTEEAMDPGRSGYLVPPAQPKALANRAAALLASPEQAAAMGQHGKQYLSDEFSRQRMVERIASVVRSELASARRIPVLYLITELGVGGAQSSLARLLRRLDRDRYAPTVACLFGGEGAIAKQIRALGIDVVDLGMRHKGRVDALARLAGLIRRLRPTILQSLLFHADMAARTVGSACRVPVVITSRRNTRIGPLYREQIRRATASLDDCVVAVCEAARDAEIQRAGADPSKVLTIHNGIDPSELVVPSAASIAALRAEARVAPGAPLFGFVGRLHEQKGLRSLLAAFKQVHNRCSGARLALIGDGGQRAGLETLARAHGLVGQTIFTGFRRDIRAWMGAMDALVMPSEYEGLSNAIMEAMASRRAVVATRVGGTPELVEHRRTGLLVDAGDTAGLSSAMMRLADDAESREALGQAGLRRIHSEFGLDRQARRTEALYERLLEQTVPRHRVARR